MKKMTFSSLAKRNTKNSVNFNICGTANLNSEVEYQNENLKFLFSPTYLFFQNMILDIIANKTSSSILKFGDGDYFFLKGISEGSAKPGKRALSIDYENFDLSPFKDGWNVIDHFACEISLINRNRFYELAPNRMPSFPAEYLYASVANHWFTSSLGVEVAVIGADLKVNLVEELQKNEDYLNYIGAKSPMKTIRIPQKYACDDIEKTIKDTLVQVEKSGARVFLVGVGHAKSALLPALAQNYPGVFIDIGSGIDALAGVIDIYRPYFGDWTNFQFSDRGYYEGIDFLQVKSFGEIKYFY